MGSSYATEGKEFVSGALPEGLALSSLLPRPPFRHACDAPCIPALETGLWEPSVPKVTVLWGGRPEEEPPSPASVQRSTSVPNLGPAPSSGACDNLGRGGKRGFTRQARDCKSQADVTLTPQFLQALDTCCVTGSTSHLHTSRDEGEQSPLPHTPAHMSPPMTILHSVRRHSSPSGAAP